MNSINRKIISFGKLKALSLRLKKKGKKIVTTNGCFDLLHWGHINYLMEAGTLGDVLICAINSDASVKRLKGPSRPLCNERIRMGQVAALEAVDYVVIFREQTPVRFLKMVRPHIHVKGGDYHPEKLPEREVVEEGGGKVVCLSLVRGYSTTDLIKKLRARVKIKSHLSAQLEARFGRSD